MSAFPNNKARLGTVLLLVTLSMPAAATIVVDGSAVRLGGGMAAERSVMVSSSAASYPLARSHAWMKYQRGNPATGRALVGVPFNGAWMASSSSQSSARSHVARAQAYRLGERE